MYLGQHWFCGVNSIKLNICDIEISISNVIWSDGQFIEHQVKTHFIQFSLTAICVNFNVKKGITGTKGP